LSELWLAQTYVLVNTCKFAIDPLLFYRGNTGRNLVLVLVQNFLSWVGQHQARPLSSATVDTVRIRVINVLPMHTTTVPAYSIELGAVEHFRKLLEFVLLVLLDTLSAVLSFPLVVHQFG
jgi:hypothetical protein